MENGPLACDADTIREDVLQEVTVKALNMIYHSRDKMLAALEENIAGVIGWEEDPYREIDERLEEIQHEIINKANAKLPYPELADELNRLREERRGIQIDEAEKAGISKRIDEMKEYLRQVDAEISEYDEGLVRTYFEKITVYDDRFGVEFKTGVKVDIAR